MGLLSGLLDTNQRQLNIIKPLVAEINKLEADIVLADQHRVFINGPTELKGNEIVCPPALRPAMIILVAMLGAKGQSILRNVYSINRGYEDIAKRLNAIGTDITLLDN